MDTFGWFMNNPIFLESDNFKGSDTFKDRILSKDRIRSVKRSDTFRKKIGYFTYGSDTLPVPRFGPIKNRFKDYVFT